MLLDNAIVYDIETYPNCFTFAMENLNDGTKAVWEISDFRDDSASLIQYFQWLSQNQIVMTGFNSVHFDYPVIHAFWKNPALKARDLYNLAMSIIQSTDRFKHVIWGRDRFTPQLDLFKMHHFDNPAKSTSLKTLEINMRLPSVEDLPIEAGTVLTQDQIDNLLVPYNKYDVTATKTFAHYSKPAIDFRLGMLDKFGIDVLNWNDTKIGEQIVIQKLGDDVCFDRSSGKKKRRQTPRNRIQLSEIVFPYITFNNPEFQRILNYFKSQTLEAKELNDIEKETPTIKTKGFFKDLNVFIGGVSYHYGTGGIHGSLEKKRVHKGGGYIIRDIDVASLYPSIAIANRLAPEHLGQAFVDVYASLPIERKKWQKEKGKKCPEANSLKLGGNGVYGKSNSPYSVFYDPKFTMSITINGQLLLSMLIEKLLEVPTIQIIQANTDGITYFVHESYEPQCVQLCTEWEALTGLVLEGADYKAMYIRDVNNYIAVGEDGSVKLKGAYWTPDPMDYHGSVGSAQPPAWHKNLSNPVSTRAAVANMVHGIAVESFIRACTNQYDFMCSIKTRRSDKLFWGDAEQQKNTRYYVSIDGREMTKLAPPAGPIGAYKKANGVTDHQYQQVMAETGGQWDERVCTKNKSKYENRITRIEAGHRVTVCNKVDDFSFENVNYDWYINEALKLLV